MTLVITVSSIKLVQSALEANVGARHGVFRLVSNRYEESRKLISKWICQITESLNVKMNFFAGFPRFETWRRHWWKIHHKCKSSQFPSTCSSEHDLALFKNEFCGETASYWKSCQGPFLAWWSQQPSQLPTDQKFLASEPADGWKSRLMCASATFTSPPFCVLSAGWPCSSHMTRFKLCCYRAKNSRGTIWLFYDWATWLSSVVLLKDA